MKRVNKTSNFENPDLNPCFEESNLSMKCLERNNYDTNKCNAYFQNVRECKKFWGKIIRARKQLGINPVVPTLEERTKIIEKRKLGDDVVFCN